MKTFKEFLIQQKVTWQYSEETVPFFARKSVKLGIGVVFLLFGTFLLAKNISGTQNQYADVATTPALTLEALEPTSKEKTVTLILYRDDCEACQRVEKEVVKRVKANKATDKNTVLVTNLNDMKPTQRQFIQQKLPDIMIDHTKIPTPLVANLEIKTDGNIRVVEQSNTDDVDKIVHVLNHSF